MKHMSYGERLKWARKSAGLTQIQLSESSGVKQGTISKIERGDQSESSYDAILGHHLGVDPYWLSTGEGSPLSVKEETPTYIDNNVSPVGTVRKVPLISWVVAGEFCESPDNFSPGDAEEWLETPFKSSDHSYCLVVEGDSMFPDYRDGEIIQVDPQLSYRHNDDVVVRTQDGKHTFKRIQVTAEGEYLLAVNPDHPKRKIEMPEGTAVCGVVVGSWMRRRR